MKLIAARSFFRNPYQYLKELPITITVDGKRKYVMTRFDINNVVTENVTDTIEAKDVVTKEYVVTQDNANVATGWNPLNLSKGFFARKGK